MDSLHLNGNRLPEDCVIRMLSFISFKEFTRTWTQVRSDFASQNFYTKNIRSVTIVPSAETPTIDSGMEEAAITRMLILKPGVYRHSLRVTKDICVQGAGPLGSVVIEAPGWEKALSFAGLGYSGEYVNRQSNDTGENAIIRNICFRTINEQQTVACHIVRGAPTLDSCMFEGEVWVSGRCSTPLIINSHIRYSLHFGLQVNDNAKPSVQNCTISYNNMGGILISSGGAPELKGNTIKHWSERFAVFEADDAGQSIVSPDNIVAISDPNEYKDDQQNNNNDSNNSDDQDDDTHSDLNRTIENKIDYKAAAVAGRRAEIQNALERMTEQEILAFARGEDNDAELEAAMFAAMDSDSDDSSAQEF